MNFNPFFNKNYQLQQLISFHIKLYNFSITLPPLDRIFNIWTPFNSLVRFSYSKVNLSVKVSSLSANKYSLVRSNYAKFKYYSGRSLCMVPKIKYLNSLLFPTLNFLFFFWYNSHFLFSFWYRWVTHFNSIYSFKNNLLSGYKVRRTTYTLTYL